MKSVIIYDSRHGNTEKIAHAIGAGLAAAGEVEVIRVADAQPDRLPGIDLLLVGAPTHGSNPSEPMHGFLERIPDGALTGVRVAAFDTRTDMEKLTGMMHFLGKIFDRLGYAAPKISARLAGKGAQVVMPPEGFIVLDTEGPLEDGELERAVAWAAQLVV